MCAWQYGTLFGLLLLYIHYILNGNVIPKKKQSNRQITSYNFK